MFHIKICGVQRPGDIEAVELNGADAIGLNFFRPSVRFVDPEAATTRQLSSLAAAAAYRAEQRGMDTQPPLRFLTASLHVDYLRPTPLGVPLEIRGTIKEVKGRKVVVAATLSANGEICARGEVVAVQAPPDLVAKLSRT